MSAMRRIRLRYVLPVLFTILYGVLTIVSDHQDRVFRERIHAAYKDPSIFVRDDFPVTPSNWAKDCLFGIALPAVIVAFPLLLLIGTLLPQTAAIYVADVIVGGFVMVLWFLLGSWFDRGLHASPPSTRWLGRLIEVGYSFMLLCDGLLFIVFAASLFAYNVSRHSIVPLAFLLGWAGLFTFYLNRRRQARLVPLQSSGQPSH